jgi:hypothetical protein
VRYQNDLLEFAGGCHFGGFCSASASGSGEISADMHATGRPGLPKALRWIMGNALNGT